MDLKALVNSEVKSKAPRILLHSKHGLGKSSWAAVSPTPIFIQTEDGLGEVKREYGIASFPLAKTVDDVFKYIDLLIEEEHDYKTVVVDTIDWFEKLAWDAVCVDKKAENIEDIGYARGYTFAMHYHETLINKLSLLRDIKNMAIVLLAHNEIKTFNNPEGENYDQYVIKLHKKAAAKYEEFCDAVLFMNHKAYIQKGKKVAVGSGERAIYTEGRPAFTAKSRYKLPYEITYNKGEGFTNIINIIRGVKYE
jgi:hypothetical protein